MRQNKWFSSGSISHHLLRFTSDWSEVVSELSRQMFTAVCDWIHFYGSDRLKWLHLTASPPETTQKNKKTKPRMVRVRRGCGACRDNGLPSEVMDENCSSLAWKTCHPGNERGGFHSMFQLRRWKLGYGNMSEVNRLLCDWLHLKWRWESRHTRKWASRHGGARGASQTGRNQEGESQVS